MIKRYTVLYVTTETSIMLFETDSAVTLLDFLQGSFCLRDLVIDDNHVQGLISGYDMLKGFYEECERHSKVVLTIHDTPVSLPETF